MQQLTRTFSGMAGQVGAYVEGASAAPSTGSPPLLEVLWRRRWTLALTVLACALLAGLYLVLGTKIYSSSASVMIQQNAPKTYSDGQGLAPMSETFMQTQADVFRSTPVLTRALEAVNYRTLKMFAKVTGDPVAWLRKGNGFKVEVPRKSDTVTISMECAYADEAADFVNAVVDAYVTEQAQQRRAMGAEMVRVLRKERDDYAQERAGLVEQMLKAKRDNGVVSFREDKNNTALERMTSLSASHTAAEIAAMELRSQEITIKAAMATPASIAAFVTAQQSKGRDSGDREYEELKRQYIQTSLALSTSLPMVGASHPRYLVLKAAKESLEKRIAEKEREIATAQLADVTALRTVAEDKERGLAEALKISEQRALDLTPAAAAYAKLEADADRLAKKSEFLDSRISELTVNNKTGLLNVQLLEPARAGETPIKPNRLLVMAIALMLGGVLGIGLAMLRDVQDSRLRRPEEIISLLGTAVLATIPRISARLSPVTRGQIVRFDARSAVAEAYRSVRTALQLGMAGKAKTILIASPTEGDGKSTTASNLAIAFAHAGERTLIIDCDLREPVQHLIFENDGRLGLTSVMHGEAQLQDAIKTTHVSGLYVLDCGPVPVNPSEMLTSKRFGQLMQALGATFDRIIIDSPPLMNFTDAQLLAAASDATLLVLRMNQSMRQVGQMAMEALAKVGANVMGAVANDVAAVRVYRKYGGAWQYAASGGRYLGAAVNADIQPAGAATGKAKADVLTIREPEWSTDAR
jgi:capsular exopolysaccharide synthesis family protein